MKTKQTILAFVSSVGLMQLLLSPAVYAKDCNGYTTSILSVCGIDDILKLVINILSAGIGIVAVGGIIYGSIMYSTAGGSMDQTKQAKKIIFNVVIGIAAYAIAYSFLNYLIPGGLIEVKS
ncbi:MAG: hypothetical protein WA087_04000 [Candidatus Saccharimonadales bacterium]